MGFTPTCSAFPYTKEAFASSWISKFRMSLFESINSRTCTFTFRFPTACYWASTLQVHSLPFWRLFALWVSTKVLTLICHCGMLRQPPIDGNMALALLGNDCLEVAVVWVNLNHSKIVAGIGSSFAVSGSSLGHSSGQSVSSTGETLNFLVSESIFQSGSCLILCYCMMIASFKICPVSLQASTIQLYVG